MRKRNYFYKSQNKEGIIIVNMCYNIIIDNNYKIHRSLL